QGRVVGTCIGAFRRDEDLARLLDRLVQEPDWRTAVDIWSAAAERGAIREALRGAGIPEGDDLRPAAAWRALSAGLPGGDTAGLGAIALRLDGLMRAHMAE